MRACWNRQTGKLVRKVVWVQVPSLAPENKRHTKVCLLFFCAEPVACGRLCVPDLTVGEHIEMDEHIFFYMGETQERCVFCWLDAPVSK